MDRPMIARGRRGAESGWRGLGDGEAGFGDVGVLGRAGDLHGAFWDEWAWLGFAAKQALAVSGCSGPPTPG